MNRSILPAILMMLGNDQTNIFTAGVFRSYDVVNFVCQIDRSETFTPNISRNKTFSSEIHKTVNMTMER